MDEPNGQGLREGERERTEAGRKRADRRTQNRKTTPMRRRKRNKLENCEFNIFFLRRQETPAGGGPGRGGRGSCKRTDFPTPPPPTMATLYSVISSFFEETYRRGMISGQESDSELGSWTNGPFVDSLLFSLLFGPGLESAFSFSRLFCWQFVTEALPI